MKLNDVITAIATPPGKGGIGIIRISGSSALEVANKVFIPKNDNILNKKHGEFVYGDIISQSGELIDHGIALVMLNKKSFTGEDTIELQAHGGTVVLRSIISSVVQAGARIADPGEFSKRAFLNGKIDLTQAEAICDIINAKSDRAAKAALRQLNGSLSNICHKIYYNLIEITANLESTIDFVEDELPNDVFTDIQYKLNNTLNDINELIYTWNEGRILREGISIAIIGKPNAGKSTLFNNLLGEDRAIISSTPGTTRDFLEENYVIDGYPFKLVDTAGLRESICNIELEGIRRTKLYTKQADIILYLIDASKPFESDDKLQLSKINNDRLIIVLNKIDNGKCITINNGVEISALHKKGLNNLKKRIIKIIKKDNIDIGSEAIISERHKSLLIASKNEMILAHNLLNDSIEENSVFICDHLRKALEFIGQITGQIYHNELLDNIFSRFCIGK